ncbi:MAG: hypothetical protein JXQ83_11355 [Candidatus Glassbacteria bacterium]|nr:hypothetical protein [Candidatus Glassbacteria bacterium]
MKAIAVHIPMLPPHRAVPRFMPVWAVLLAISLGAFSTARAQEPATESLITTGDLNGDGGFDMLDLIQLGRAVFLDLSLPEKEVETCDADGDKKLTNYDLLVMTDALDLVQKDKLDVFSSIELSIQKDVDKGEDNVESFLDLARFYRKEKRLDKARRVLEMIIEGLDTRHPLYEIITNTMTMIDDEEASQQLMEEAARSQDLFRADDDLGGKVSLRRMMLQMQGNLNSMLEDNQYASNYNGKKVKTKLNAVMENMLRNLSRDQMVDPAAFSRLNSQVRDVLEDPGNLVQALNPQQRNRIYGEVEKSTSSMREEAMKLRQKVAEQEKAVADARKQQQEQDLPASARLDRREWRLDVQRAQESASSNRTIVANPPKLTPDTISVVAPQYTLEWDVSNILGARGVSLEISHANQKFRNPNGMVVDEDNQLFYSPDVLLTIAGKRAGSALQLEGVGNYYFRVAALDAEKNFMSKFSDATELVVVYNNVNTIANKPDIEPKEVALDNPQYTIRWDVSNVEGARDAAVEISKPDEEFANPNGKKPDLINQCFYNPRLGKISGRWNGDVSGLPGPGAYLFRVGAISPQGDFIGCWSDPETLIVKDATPQLEQPPEKANELIIPPPPEVSVKDTVATVTWDVSAIDGVKGVVLEISPLEDDSVNPGKNNYNQKIIGARGSVNIQSRSLNSEGELVARIAVLDKAEKMVGLWSTPSGFRFFRYNPDALAQNPPVSQSPPAGLQHSGAAEEPPPQDGIKLKVIKKTVTLYKDMSLSSAELATINEGDILFLNKTTDRWYNVTVPGKSQKGWVLKYDVEQLE